jgi:Carboxypeptidase regulatory-like domain/TonB dependent receptor-like, beta-barrel/TonB-dependent Receptor Plug Domain
MAGRDLSHITACFAALVVLIATALVPVPIDAQVTGATLSGTITDSSGAIIPRAEVTITNSATAVSRAVTTNADGLYAAPNLLPGAYDITIAAPGFSTEVRTGITLTVGAEQVLNVTLKVGQATEKVEVTGAAPAVQLATSSLSNEVNSTTVRELPLNGRDWTSLAALQPGISSLGATQQDPSQGYNRGNRGYGVQLTISGARPQQNNYRVDGISVNDYANGGPGSVLGGSLGVDAIQEFSVLSSNYSAEYGRTSGGVVNAITRSGTNQFHGDAYWFLRDEGLDARNFFDGNRPPFHRNQFGASAGGPIRKDRTFVFGDYEGIRQAKGVTNLNHVLSPDARNGIIHNADGTTCTIGVLAPGCSLQNSAKTLGVDPLVQPYLPLWSLPNAGLISPGNTGNYLVATNQVTTEDFVTARIDHKISDKDSLAGSYQHDKSVLSLPDKLNDLVLGNSTGREFFTLEESHIFSPQLVNSARAGFNREVANNSYTIKAVNPAAADAALAAVPGQFAPQINVSTLTSFAGGVDAASRYKYAWNSFQGYDDAFLTKGNHSLKFGGGVERIQSNPFGVIAPGGAYQFGSLQAFLTNQPKTFSAALPSNVAPLGLRQTIFGAYLQDDIRWRPNLTVNLGLRYETATVPTEVQNKLINLRTITEPGIHVGSPFFSNPTHRNFEPRIGFAWDPFHNGKTSMRGGFGLFDVLPLVYIYHLPEISGAPNFLNGTAGNLSAGSFPTGAFTLVSAPGHLRDPLIEFDPHRNYVMQWNFNIQREITPSLTAMAAYVGSRGVHQPFAVDSVNIVLPVQKTSAGYLWPSPVGSGTVVNPSHGRIDSRTWSNNSFYDALQAQVIKRMSHGFQAQGSYTWGKAIDEGSASMIGDPFGNSVSSLFFFDRHLRRGVSDFNVAQNLVINFTWIAPTPHSLSGSASWLLGGWQFGAIYSANSGTVFTPTFGIDGDPLGLNSSDPWDFPNRLAGPGCHSAVSPGHPDNYVKTQCFTVPSAPSQAFWAANCDPQPLGPGTPLVSFPQCFNLLGNSGRNTLTGPGLSNLDFSIFKNNYIKRISESFNVQFRAEFFNILNRANFQAPLDFSELIDSTGAPIPGAGAVDATSTSAREIQFALKLIW